MESGDPRENLRGVIECLRLFDSEKTHEEEKKHWLCRASKFLQDFMKTIDGKPIPLTCRILIEAIYARLPSQQKPRDR